MVKKFMLALLVVFAGLVLFVGPDTAFSKHSIVTTETTKEGWTIVFVKDITWVQDLCGGQELFVLGCTYSEEKHPSKNCLIIVAVDPYHPHSTLDTVNHEKRHCREGAFHK